MNFHFKIKVALYKNMETVVPGFLGFKHFSNKMKYISPFPKLLYFHSQLLLKSFEDHVNELRKHKNQTTSVVGCMIAPELLF